MNLTIWMQSIVIILVGTVGTILFKIGVNRTPGISFNEPLTIVKFVFSPYIVISLALFLLGRVLLSLPLKTIDVGKYMFLITPLTLVATLVLSIFFLEESLNLKELLGILLTITGVLFIGS